ncbi:MAG: biopolymer transporter ExbD [bacterium]|nr:biopolymer transporter ExbD [bacterium]
MSGRSQLQEIASEEHEMEMTSMIDVTFLLLIFFMCTLKFKTLEGKLAAYLPKDVGVNQSDAEPIEKVEILLRVKAEGNKLDVNGKAYNDPTGKGRFTYDGTRSIEYSVGTKRTRDIDEIGKRLRKVYKDKERLGQEKIPATIDARPGTIYSDVVKVLDKAIDAGFNDITFVGAYDDHIK